MPVQGNQNVTTVISSKTKQPASLIPVKDKSLVKYKILSFDELYVRKCTIIFYPLILLIFLSNIFLQKNGCIDSSTNEVTLKLIKQLDDKLLDLNAERQQAFVKNQVKLVNKYLDQFQPKNNIKKKYFNTNQHFKRLM
jgi:hypothetical protein